VCLDPAGKIPGGIYNRAGTTHLLLEKSRCGIGTFVPSDPKSQDIAELVGSIDLSTIGDYGSESDPRAYRFDGELKCGQPGLDGIYRNAQADERFLYVLLTLAKKKILKRAASR